jgi:uncharacterized membrane protein (DUF4010 family)
LISFKDRRLIRALHRLAAIAGASLAGTQLYQSQRAADAVLHRATAIVIQGAPDIVLVLGVAAGLYVLVGPILVALVGGVVSAWLLLTKITE